jgi:hypothetical protein
VKRWCTRLVVAAAGLTLISAGMVRAAEVKYTFKSLATLDSTVAGHTITGDFEVATLNARGELTFVVETDGGEIAMLINSNREGIALSPPGGPSPVGGTFGTGLSNKVGLNDSGNVAFTEAVDLGDGAVEGVLFWDRAADKWTHVVKGGMPAPGGGTIASTVSFCTLNNFNDIVFAGNLGDNTAAFLSDGTTRELTLIAGPGTKIGSTTFENCRRVQIGADNRIITFEGQTAGSDNFGAYGWKDGELFEIAAVGAAAPGGGTFTELRGPIANANGDIAVLGATDAGWGAYLYTARDKKLVKVAGPGDSLPGDTVGSKRTLGNAESIGRNSIRIGTDGSVLFAAQSDDGSGVYLWRNGEISPVAVVGQTLPDIGKIAAMANSDLSSWGLGYATNGLIAFTALTEDDTTHLVLGTPVP